MASATDAGRWWQAGPALVVSNAGRGGTPVLPHATLVRRGSYRWMHPNCAAVVAEGSALPLVHTAWLTALVFTLAATLPTPCLRGGDPFWATYDQLRHRPVGRRRRPRRLATALHAPRAWTFGDRIASRESHRQGVRGEGLMPAAWPTTAGRGPGRSALHGIAYVGEHRRVAGAGSHRRGGADAPRCMRHWRTSQDTEWIRLPFSKTHMV